MQIKKKMTVRSACYPLFCLLEILILFLFAGKIAGQDKVGYLFRDYFRENAAEENGGKIYTEEIILPKGIYEIALMYEKGKGRAVCYAQCDKVLSSSNGGEKDAMAEAGPRALYSDRVSLSDIQDSRKFTIYVNEDNAAVRIIVEPESGEDFSVNWITAATAGNSGLYRIFSLAVKLLGMNIIAFVIFLRKYRFKGGREVFGVIIIGGIASLGLLEEYILYGHDLIFHLFRIEGLAEGLMAGSFPVRIQPGWFNGWGYPVSVMYGDQLLLFPAILRLIGVSVQNAYKCYIAAVNFGTAAAAYYAFLKISGNKKNALFGSCVYTLFPYRLSCIYLRAAVGEYSAMLFLPLAALGFYYAFEKINDCTEDKPVFEDGEGDSRSGRRSEAKEKPGIAPEYLIAPVIGFTGLIQTHVIVCFLAAFAIILFSMINWKKMLDKRRLIYFAKILGITALINLWFLVPFFRYMQEEFVVNTKLGMEPVFQYFGASLAELLAVYWNGTVDTTWSTIGPLSQKFPKPVGTALLIALILAVLMYEKGRLGAQKKKIALNAGFFILFSFMATNLFPYREINRILPAFGSLFGKIQFPFRLLTLAGLFGSLLAVLVFTEAFRNYDKRMVTVLMAVTGLIAVMQGAQLIYSTLYRGDMLLVYDINAFESNAVSTGEYLYEGSFGAATEDIQTPRAMPEKSGVKIEGFEKKYNTVTVICKTDSGEAGLLIPLYYYPGYAAEDLRTGERFAVIKSGENNQIGVLLPAEYEGSVRVYFKEPAVWRLAEAVSAVSAVIFLLMLSGLFPAGKAGSRLWRIGNFK